ncbi:MAG TPA: hypothetical protein EYO97_00340, partial [Gemmatimonadetes bacterium]|nr:hypothetical protein [Gemmatimonadota bacterium]
MRLGGSLARRRGGRGKRPSRTVAKSKKSGARVAGAGTRLFAALVGVAIVAWLGGYVISTQLLFPAPPPTGDLFEVPSVRGLGLA